MPQKPKTDRSTSELVALILLRLVQQPCRYSTGQLATELGESRRRVQRALVEIRVAGWRVEPVGNTQGPLALSYPQHGPEKQRREPHDLMWPPVAQQKN